MEYKTLEKLYRHRKIGRREFLAGAGALCAGVAANALISRETMAQTPKKGGRLRAGMAHGSTTDTLDPATYENNFTGALNFTIHNHLGEVNADGEIVPELAESWEATDDAAEWVFNIRPGVEFHNGKTLTAEDVLASINHHRHEDSPSPAKVLLEQVEDLKVDGNSVVFTLKAGNADFPFIASAYHLAIQPSKDGKVDPGDGIGTGGYVLENYEPGVRMFATRNPNYWKAGRAHFDEIEAITIADPAARTNALTTGEIDVADRADLKTVHLLKRHQDLRIASVPGFAHYTFAMRTDTAPFNDNNVRQALKLSIDRDEVLKKVLLGYGSVGNDHPISPSNQFYYADLPQHSYDPDKAKWYLKQAGHENLKVPLSAADAAFSGAVDAATLYKEHAKAAGIEIDVIREPNDGYWSNVWMQKPWSAVYWSGRPTEDQMFSVAYAAGGAWNDTFWANKRFNELLVAARAELNTGKRRQMYHEMQDLVSNDGGALVPMFNNYVFAMKSNVQHESKMAGNWDLDGNKYAEKWWFA